MNTNPMGENSFDLPTSDMIAGEFEIDGNKITLLETKGYEEEIIQICLAQHIGEPCGYCTIPFKDMADVMRAVWGGGDCGWVHLACYERMTDEEKGI